MSQFERVTEGIERAQRHWESRRPPGETGPHPRALTIAVSRAAGAPGTSVAREAGARLGWQVYDQELLERIAQDMGLRTSLLESVDERRVGWLQECVEAFAGVPTVSESAYIKHLVTTLLSLASHGECVIVGRAAAQVLPTASTLRVRLLASLDDRVAATSSRLGVSRQEAGRWVERTDRERVRFIKDHFQKDPTDPGNYDLLLNASRLSVGECADVIVAAVHSLQVRAAAQQPELAASL